MAFVTAMGSDSLISLDTATNSLIGSVERVAIDPSVVVTISRATDAVVASVGGVVASSNVKVDSQLALTNARPRTSPDGSAGGALDGTYPNPVIRNLTSVGTIPFVTSPGMLGQNATLSWDNVNQRLGLGVPDPDGVLTIGQNPSNARTLMFRTTEPQYGNYGFSQYGYQKTNGENRLNQTLAWGFNVDQKPGGGQTSRAWKVTMLRLARPQDTARWNII